MIHPPRSCVFVLGSGGLSASWALRNGKFNCKTLRSESRKTVNLIS